MGRYLGGDRGLFASNSFRHLAASSGLLVASQSSTRRSRALLSTANRNPSCVNGLLPVQQIVRLRFRKGFLDDFQFAGTEIASGGQPLALAA